MKLIHNVRVIAPSRKEIQVSVEAWGREGTESPTTYIILYNGRRIAPYEQRLKGWNLTLNALFALVYGEGIKTLVSPGRSFLNLIPKEVNSFGFHVPVKIKL